MSFGPYNNQLVSRCFYQLRCIKACVKALPRIDYSNCLLAGAPQYQLKDNKKLSYR